MRFCAAEMPRWHPVSVSGYHIREAGSTAAQELAFTLANGFAYVEAAMAAGLAVDDFAPRLSFFFNAHIDFFEEIAKYRAARRIWAALDARPLRRDATGARRSCASTPRPAGVSLTAQQPEVNLVRVAIEALAGVLGGTQSLHTDSFDEALALPDREGRPPGVADPAGHRRGVRRHPRRRPARRLLVRRGAHRRAGPRGRGDLRPLSSDGRRLHARRLHPRHRARTGSRAASPTPPTNSSDFSTRANASSWASTRFSRATTTRTSRCLRITNEDERRQRGRLAQVRQVRDDDAVARTLARLAHDAQDPEMNLMPALIEAAKAYATVGEMMNTMAEVFGRHVEVPSL